MNPTKVSLAVIAAAVRHVRRGRLQLPFRMTTKSLAAHQGKAAAGNGGGSGIKRPSLLSRLSPSDNGGLSSGTTSTLVGWCRLTISKPALKAPMVSALKTVIS